MNLLAKSLPKYILILLLALGLTLLGLGRSYVQGETMLLPSLNSVNKQFKDQLHLSGQIGNVLYGPVTLDGRPLIYVAVPASTSQDKGGEDKDSLLDQRIKRIENSLQEIIKRGFDPDTLQVNTSILNGETVILASDGKQIKQQIIGTVTQSDMQLYGESTNQIGLDASKILQDALVRASKERQPQYLKIQLIKALLIIGIMLFLSAFISYFRGVLNIRLRKIKESLVANNFNQQSQEIPNLMSRWINFTLNYFIFFPYFHKIRFTKIKNIPENLYSFITRPEDYFSSDEYQKILNKQLKSELLFARLLLILLLLIWLQGISSIMYLFPETRWISAKLAGTPVSLLMIWVGVIVGTKVIGLLIDWFLNTWTEAMSLGRDFSPRKISRIATLASALRGISIVLLIAVGIFLSLQAFKLPVGPVLAGAGILGFAISFGSQSIIKDMISGAINLMNDSYAIGDTVTIGSDSGLVEDVNLIVTRIRSVNGDLVTIPNGLVGIVRNQTKDWSRVDYQIQVAYNTNIEKALAILEGTAYSIYNDPQWHNALLEAPQTIGVESLSSDGIALRIWMKTKPGQQWNISRELRLRVKEAFNNSGIDIAIPHHSVSLESNTAINKDNLH